MSGRDIAEAVGMASRALAAPARSDRLTRLRRAFARAKTASPLVLDAHPAPPTITTAYDAALGTFFDYAPGSSVFDFLGGNPVSNFPGYIAQIGTTLTWTKVEFWCDAPKLQIRGAQGKAMIAVDGRYLSKSGTSTAAAGGEQQFVLDWSGVRKPRHYRLKLNGAQSFRRVGMDGESRVWKPGASDGIRVFFEGDSYMQGTGASYGGISLGEQASDLLGVRDNWVSGIGGSGWLNPGSGVTLRSRIANVTAADPDLLVIPAGTNDELSTPSAITAEVTAYLAAFRAALPNTPAVILGPWPKATGPSATLIAIEGAIQAAVTAFADPLIKFASVSADSGSAWIYGTGFNGSGSGNAKLYIGSDGVHPNDAGHEYLGARIAAAVDAAVRTMSAT